MITRRGIAAGLCLGLDVPVGSVSPSLESISVVVLMGTPMGVKGNDPSPLAARRIQDARAFLTEHGAAEALRIESDGGIRTNAVLDLRAAGSDVIVMGSLAFKSQDIARTMDWVRAL